MRMSVSQSLLHSIRKFIISYDHKNKVDSKCLVMKWAEVESKFLLFYMTSISDDCILDPHRWSSVKLIIF